MTQIEIQLAEDGQEAIIAEIHNQAFNIWSKKLGILYGYKQVSNKDVFSWKEKKGSFWLASIKNTPVAYAHCCIEENHQGQIPFTNLTFIETLESLGQSKIAVHPSYQQKGIAKTFLQELFQYYSNLGVKIILVFAYSDNIPSIHLLSSLGCRHEKLFFYEPFSKEKPFCCDSVLATLDLDKPVTPPTFLNKKIIIRQILEEDLPNIRIIFEENRPDAFGPKPTFEKIKEWYQSGWGEVTLVAELNGEAVGCMEFTSQGIIGIPGVLKKHQSKGIGSTIFYYLLKRMQENRKKLALADTGYILADAIKLYKRFNFDLSRELWCWIKEL